MSRFSVLIERKARELQLADFGGDQAAAEDKWQADLEPDGYKDSYRRQAKRLLIETLVIPVD